MKDELGAKMMKKIVALRTNMYIYHLTSTSRMMEKVCDEKRNKIPKTTKSVWRIMKQY